MSVINQMLRDLEQRKVKTPVSEHYIDEVNIIAKRQFNPWWIILPAIIILIAGGSLYIPSFIKESFNKQEVENNIKKQEVVFSNLPNDISEIEHKPEGESDDVPIVEMQGAEIQVVEKAKKSAALIESSELIKSHKQEPKKESEVVIKSKVVIKKVELKKSETKKTEQNKVEIKPSPETKITAVKAPVKSSVKSIPDKKTSAEVVYQAGQLMSTDQSAAIQLLEENIKLVSPDADYYSLLANLQQRRKKYDDAIISYRKALELEPYKGELWIGIALAYRGTGEDANALKAFKQALSSIEISPELKHYAAQQVGGN